MFGSDHPGRGGKFAEEHAQLHRHHGENTCCRPDCDVSAGQAFNVSSSRSLILSFSAQLVCRAVLLFLG